MNRFSFARRGLPTGTYAVKQLQAIGGGPSTLVLLGYVVRVRNGWDAYLPSNLFGEFGEQIVEDYSGSRDVAAGNLLIAHNAK